MVLTAPVTSQFTSRNLFFKLIFVFVALFACRIFPFIFYLRHPERPTPQRKTKDGSLRSSAGRENIDTSKYRSRKKKRKRQK
jgi:hypothetical protein